MRVYVFIYVYSACMFNIYIYIYYGSNTTCVSFIDRSGYTYIHTSCIYMHALRMQGLGLNIGRSRSIVCSCMINWSTHPSICIHIGGQHMNGIYILQSINPFIPMHPCRNPGNCQFGVLKSLNLGPESWVLGLDSRASGVLDRWRNISNFQKIKIQNHKLIEIWRKPF